MSRAAGWSVWVAHLRRTLRKLLRGGPDVRPEGTAGIEQLGHRQYVGGRWDEIGALQFQFLLSQGLLPEHRLLDVACGSLRAGVHLIPYLKRGNYCGLEKEQGLIEAGLRHELDLSIQQAKSPQFLVNSDFDVTQLPETVDYILIHSLFTHLPSAIIQRCLTQLRLAAHPDTRCFATFFESNEPQVNLDVAHDHESFFYTRDEMARSAHASGWTMQYLGDWGHPRGQKMLLLQPATLSASSIATRANHPESGK